MARNATNGQPSVYASEKLPVMRSRWSGEPGASLRSMASSVWPHTPASALMAVTANAVSASERYCSGFCAVGLYQLPESTWTALRSNSTVRSLLGGHSAVAVAEFADHIPDQVATGIVSLRRDLAAVSSQLPASIRPTEGSQWQLALALMGYVVGGQAAGRMVAAHARELAAVPEDGRFGALAHLAAIDGSRAMVYPVTRAWQRLATGRALAGSLGGDTGWYDVAAVRETEAALAAALYGGTATLVPSGGGGGLIALVAIGAGVWWWMRKKKR